MKILKLPADIHARLEALRDGQGWAEFVTELEATLRPTRERNPHRYYFNKNLDKMHLTEAEVCWLCQRRSALPVPLVSIDYLDLTFGVAHKEGLNITRRELQIRFDLAGLLPQAPGCPACGAYEGQRRLEDLTDEILPERSAERLKNIYKSAKCNTK